MITKKLNKKDIKNIYDINMPKDFPKEEIREWSNFERLIDNKNYTGIGFYENNTQKLIAYALLVDNKSSKIVLLDYFAVIKEKRGSGEGTKSLNYLLKYYNKYKIIMLEVENPDYATDSTSKIICEKRIKFYNKNKIIQSKVLTKVLNVPFSVMYYNSNNFSTKFISDSIKDIYMLIFNNLDDVAITNKV